MSFHLESTPNSIDRLINDYPTYGLAQVSAAVIRLGGKLGAQPWPTDEHPEHVVVFRIDGGSKIQKSEARRLARFLNGNWIRIPPHPGIS